ncbi:hypothetical protein [Pontibacter ruber]|uniref:Outer membrane protein beta-barrel domain-containing protein n=1 Tax=Pontibacter ruber TaxID=1343895 RepID=A0ABW5D3R2_9BACT|nr:hypothetical protein [Pontibacter ruber]
MKKAFLLFAFCCCALLSNAQTRNTVYLELLGKNIMGPAILYERNPNSKKNLSLHYGAGVGAINDFNDEWHPSLPLFVGGNLGKKNNKFEFGLAGAVTTKDYFETSSDECYDCLGPNDQSIIVPLTLYLGFKHYPKKGKGFFYHANAQPIVITNSFIPVIPWFGLGIGYSTQTRR